MGSLVLPSKAPASVPKNVVQSSGSANSDVSQSAPDETPSDVLASEARAESLLRRNRGRLGTILTGFNGALATSTQDKQRKTLLGE